MRRCELNTAVGAVAGSQFKMACFTRPVVWRFWTAVLLLSDMLAHLVRAASLEEQIQPCLDELYLGNPPSTYCTTIFLYFTGLTGTIPTELGLLTAVEYM